MNAYTTTQKVKELTGTRKKQFYLMTSTKYYCTTGWSGGSISYYSLKNFKTGADLEMRGVGNQFNAPTESQEMPVDSLLIETGMFSGKPSTPRLMCRPEQEAEVKQYLGIA